jgi:hypothetical protein
MLRKLASLRLFHGHGGRMLRFAVVGVANTAIDVALFSFLYYAQGWPPLWANSAGYAAGLANSYLCDHLWTFRAAPAPLEPALPGPALALAGDHVGSLIHQRRHRSQELGRVPEVGVDDQDAVAGADRETGGEGELVAVVARRVDADHPPVAPREVGDDGPRGVAGAVVDQDDLVVIPDHPVAGRGEPLAEGRQALLLVEAGDHRAPRPPSDRSCGGRSFRIFAFMFTHTTPVARRRTG